MKKAAKVIIPIVLVLVILLGTAWYLFMYDTEFTRDMFLHTARFFHERGNYDIATWCYDRAYDQSGDSASVAIELSSQHAEAGNYLQAEKALTSAIADNPSSELYIALSKLYIEQDKLKDAVELMERICDPEGNVKPEIRDELTKMRPAAPTFDVEKNPEDNELNKSVTFSHKDGTMYASKDVFPSLKNNAHKITGSSKRFVYDEGQNEYYALVIADNGLASSLTTHTYELNSNHRRVTEVKFVDTAVEKALRETLNVDDSTVVMTNQLWEITSFTVPTDAKNLDDLYHLIGVTELTIESVPSDELSVLVNLQELKTLTIKETVVNEETIELIGTLPCLESLTLNKCGLSTLNGLDYAKMLTFLDLTGNAIVDITPIAKLAEIQTLLLNENSLSTLPDLSGMTKLQTLEIANNVLTSVSGIENCNALLALDISGNRLNSIQEVTSVYTLNKLDFSNNQVTQLPQWDTSCHLVTINGASNNITDLTPLSGLGMLNNVLMDDNKNLESIDCLAKCPVLIRVEVYGTKVKNVKALTDMSVIVKYDPTSG